MSFLPSSAVQIVEQTTDHLTILVPPYYNVASMLFVPALLVLWLFVNSLRHNSPAIMRVTAAGILLIVLGSIVVVGTYKTLITLSRNNDSLSIQSSVVGIQTMQKTYPLHMVNTFNTYTSSGTRIGAVLKSGEEITVTKAVTTQAGYSRAIEAMNNFLETVAAR